MSILNGSHVAESESTAARQSWQSRPSVASDRDELRVPPGDSPWLRWLVCSLIAVFLAAIAVWAFEAGMRLRWDIWYCTRTIRFVGDFENATNWGGATLDIAQEMANARHGSARQEPSIWDIWRGEDQFYQDLVQNQSGNFQVDYPPLRLLVMTLWVEHVRETRPAYDRWPGQWHLLYNSSGDATALTSEQIATPLIEGNAFAAAMSAVIVFFLVWIWVNRGGRPAAKRAPAPRFLRRDRSLVPWKPVPLRSTSGLIAFPLTVWAFFYSVIIALSPSPSPPPIVALAGPPLVVRSGGSVNAVVRGIVNSQGGPTQWWIEYGQNDFSNSTRPQETDSTGRDVNIGATLRNLPDNATIHYRLVARNDIRTGFWQSAPDTGRGTTRSDDAMILTGASVQPVPSTEAQGAVWLGWQQWLGIAIVFGAMCWSLKVLPPAHRGWACGLVAALLLWFNPAILVDAHVWPQWDVWVLPPFLLAALLATLDWWFTAGMVLAVGVMFKGQTMIASPVLLLWPLLSLRWNAALRILIGFVLLFGIILSPWIVLGNQPPHLAPQPIRWIVQVCVAALIAGLLSLYRGPVWRHVRQIDWRRIRQKLRWPGRSSAAAVPSPSSSNAARSRKPLIIFWAVLAVGILSMIYLVLRLWPPGTSPSRWTGLFLLLIGIALPPWLMRRKTLALWSAGVLAAALWLSPFLFNGDWSWLTVGFEYGTQKFDVAAMGNGSNGNLGAILAGRFGWNLHDPVMTLHPPDIANTLHGMTHNADGSMKPWVHDWSLDGSPLTLDLRQFLIVVFAVLLGVCGFAAGIQDRRNSPRILCAFAAAWAIMPNVLCQMSCRYQIWGAAISCMLIAISPGLTVLHILMSLLAAGMVGNMLLGADPSRSPQLRDFLSRFSPDDGWIMIAIAAIFLYTALAPGRRAEPGDLALD